MIQLLLFLKIITSKQTEHPNTVCFSPRKSHTFNLCILISMLFFKKRWLIFSFPLSNMRSYFSLKCNFHSSLGYQMSLTRTKESSHKSFYFQSSIFLSKSQGQGCKSMNFSLERHKLSLIPLMLIIFYGTLDLVG